MAFVVPFCSFLIAIALVNGARCPVRLLDASSDGERFELDNAGLRYLSQLESPLYIVPVLGVYRSGKSFTLNRCMGLHAPYDDGFGVGHTQESHTRGINVCAERVQNLGTVVWMDVEGLFSSELASSRHGPRLFSLALLFASVVLLNNPKVFSDEFVRHFGEQQQVARALRSALERRGFDDASNLLPRGLNVLWVLQQPVFGNVGEEKLLSQLDSFLSADSGGARDEVRSYIRRDFQHKVHAVPCATNDIRKWGSLDKIPEDELDHDFVQSTMRLRELVFKSLQDSRPLYGHNVSAQLRGYTELVRMGHFGKHMDAVGLEQAELSARCAEYRVQLAAATASSPTPNLQNVVKQIRESARSQATAAAEIFHFNTHWLQRLQRCLDQEIVEVEFANDKKIVELWMSEVQALSENESTPCYFLDQSMDLSDDIARVRYGRKLTSALRSEGVEHAVRLQRSKLVECLRLNHIVRPFVPWMAWPVMAFYIANGIVTGLTQMALHSVAVAGGYAVLTTFKQMPSPLDLDFPILQGRPELLDSVMLLLPRMPWARLADAFFVLGVCWCGFKLIREIADKMRPAGDPIGGMVNLELKLNALLKRSEVVQNQQLLKVLQDVQTNVSCHDAEGAGLAAFRALSMFRDDCGADQLCLNVAGPLRRRVQKRLDGYRAKQTTSGVCEAWNSRDVYGCALRGEYQDVVVQLLEVIDADRTCRSKHPLYVAAGGG